MLMNNQMGLKSSSKERMLASSINYLTDRIYIILRMYYTQCAENMYAVFYIYTHTLTEHFIRNTCNTYSSMQLSYQAIMQQQDNAENRLPVIQTRLH